MTRSPKTICGAWRSTVVVATLLAIAGGIGAQAPPDRSKPPALGAPPTLKLPPLQRGKLSNGVPVIMMEKRSVPVVQINLLVNVGQAEDPSGKPGFASLVFDMMDEGAGTRNALELADAIDYLGADIASFAGAQTSGVSLHAPVSKLQQALPLIADIALRPVFAPQELEREKKERLTTLLQWHDQPVSIAAVLAAKTLWGPTHPYGIPALGTESSIRACTVDDLKSFHSTYVHAGNATIVAVGDFAARDLLPKLEASFGKWPRKEPARKIPAVPSQVSGRSIYLVDKPAAAQSVIQIGRIGAARVTGDYFPIVVMNTILGGSFTSRLNQNLREQHGYSYGAHSSFDLRRIPGPFTAASSVQTAVTDKALSEFMKELYGMLQPLSDEEITRAKNYVALGYPDNFQSVAQIAVAIQELVVYNLPDNYFNSYIPSVLAVTKADVERVAKKYIDPQNIAVMVVGDRKATEQGIRDLKLGELRVQSVEDVLGPRPVLEAK